ncbi:MAG: aldo/keto reductase [Chloroflexi bacterium]|nr:aldo/keto reductase [Chloroflexota bacterium]
MADLGELGVGTWEWGDRAVWGYGSEYGASEVRAAFDAALGCGIRLFDTAEIYGSGESERLVGGFIRESGATVAVATKFFPYPGRLFVRGSLLRALESSLERLGLDHVELYQIHWPLPLANTVWADELAAAVESGLTRRVGVSNFGPRKMRKMHAALLRRGVQLSTNQVQYSLLHRGPEQDGLLRACEELGVQVIAYSPLAQGLLGGRYSPDNPPPLRRRVQAGGKLQNAWRTLPTVREIAHTRNWTPAQVALNWVICHGAIPIPGAKSAEQARENAGALGWRLSADEVDQLDRVSSEP